MKRPKKIDAAEALSDNGNHVPPDVAAKQKAASIEVARQQGLTDDQIEKLFGVKVRPQKTHGNGHVHTSKKSTP